MGPEERVLKALENVQDCAAFVIAAAEGRDLDDYRSDRLFRQAIERNLEIIGGSSVRRSGGSSGSTPGPPRASASTARSSRSATA